MKKKPKQACFCGREVGFAACCAPLLQGERHALTAEDLMRSRFSAFCLKNRDYLLQTWAKSTRPDDLEFDDHIKWLRLEIVQKDAGGETDTAGKVAFIAYFKYSGRAEKLQENSRFLRDDQGFWRYVDGEFPDNGGA